MPRRASIRARRIGGLGGFIDKLIKGSIMKKLNHEYNIGDKVFLHRDTGCSKGTITEVIMTIVDGELNEEYKVNCSGGTIRSDINHIGLTKEEVINKLIKVQVDSLSVFERFMNKYIRQSSYETGGSITALSSLHRQGYVFTNLEEIQLVHFDKVEYVKGIDGVEVKFYYDGKCYHEAYVTVQEATDRLREKFTAMEVDMSEIKDM